MTGQDEGNGMEFDVSSEDADALYELFCKVGVLSSGGEEFLLSDFPNCGDETATYRNATFCIRRFAWDDRDDDFDPVRDVNFEHFPSGLKLTFYKHVGRSTYANRKLRGGEMAAIAEECARSLGETHKKGLPRPHLVGTVDHVERRTSAKGTFHRTITIDGNAYPCFDATVRTPAVGEIVAVRRLQAWKGKKVIAFIEEPCDLAEAKAIYEAPPATWSRAPELDQPGRGGSTDALAWRQDATGRVMRLWPNIDPNRAA